MHRRLTHVTMAALATSLASLGILVTTASACPFCKALEPTLAQRRDNASFVLLAELLDPSSEETVLKVHQTLDGTGGTQAGETLSVPIIIRGAAGSLHLLFAEPHSSDQASPRSWSSVAVDETSAAYLARAPGLRRANVERLRYFADYLEHRDPLIAADAYYEFGHAPYEEVAEVADRLSAASLREWLIDESVPAERKGFYALALALASGENDRDRNRALLEKIALKTSDDFSAYLDGAIAGYWLLAGHAGLEAVEKQILANPDAADGLVRHAIAAVRFYHQYGRDIPPARLAEALRHLLARPEFASMIIVDLARLQDWDALPRVVELYDDEGCPQPATRRAVVGYLLTCPHQRAREELEQLRKREPVSVREAEEYFSRLGGRA